MSTESQEQFQEKIDEQAAVFSALADPTRLKLVSLLRNQRDPDALCVNALAALLGVTQPAVSQHLRVLRAAGLIKGERRGYHIHYFVNQAALEKYRKLVLAALSIEESGNEQACREFCPERRKQDVSSD